MFKIIAVTDPGCCQKSGTANLEQRLQLLAAADIDAIILRAQGLDDAAYLALAQLAQTLCRTAQMPLLLHSHVECCRQLNYTQLHVGLPQLRQHPELRAQVKTLGVSVHSLEEASCAADAGADYLVAGHIFATACKQGLPGRGCDWLQNLCSNVALPVYAIGGITPANIGQIHQAGAAGACLMSSLMTCDAPAALVRKLRKALTATEND